MADCHVCIACVAHDSLNVGKVNVDFCMAQNKLGYRQNCGLENVISQSKGLTHGKILSACQKLLVGDNYQGVNICKKVFNSLFGRFCLSGTLKAEGLGYYCNGENTQILGDFSYYGSCTCSCAAAHTCCDEDHVSAIEKAVANAKAEVAADAYQAESYTAILTALCERYEASALLLGSTRDGKELAPYSAVEAPVASPFAITSKTIPVYTGVSIYYNDEYFQPTDSEGFSVEVFLYNGTTYLPVREDVVANEAWATDPSTYVCNGPYTMTAWEHNSKITLTKNAGYHGAADITLETLNCHLSDDANNMLTNFKNGDWLMIDDVPTNEIATLKAEYPEEFVVAGQIGTYYVCWNINEPLLP